MLASGPIPPNPSELLGTDTAKHVLEELRARYDYVIIDACRCYPSRMPRVLARCRTVHW